MQVKFKLVTMRHLWKWRTAAVTQRLQIEISGIVTHRMSLSCLLHLMDGLVIFKFKYYQLF